jgi:hypothetical protein
MSTFNGVDDYGFGVAPRPPRPQVSIGAGLVMFGAVLHIIGVFMPWYEGDGRTLRGLDTFLLADGSGDLNAPGKVWLVVGAVLLGLGFTSYLIGRQLAVVLVTLVLIFPVGLLMSLLGVGAANGERDALGGVGDAATGAFLGVVSMLIALAGAIHMLAKRRR